MAKFSRRVLILLTGLFVARAINQRFEASSTKVSSPTPTPTPELSNELTELAEATETAGVEEDQSSPAPDKKTPPSSTDTANKKIEDSPPKAKPDDTPAPQDSASKAEEGVVIAKSSELALRQTKVFYLKDSFGIPTGYSLTRTSRGVVAFDTRCTHAGVPSALVGDKLECPAHGSIFDPESGQVLTGPAIEPLRSYPTLEINGEIRILIS
jgi:Rieske Fe-S protein